jgi:predicted nucleic acid-binding protein
MADSPPPWTNTPGRVLRVCVDLNVWCAAIYADARGRTGSAAQLVVNAVRLGKSSLGEIQLVISWGMLNRLQKVLHREFPLTPEAVEAALSAIYNISRLGPQGDVPHLLLGGTGVLALRDEEDAHVLDVAVAGRADLLITSNFKDFIGYRKDVREENRIAISQTPSHSVIIAHLFVAAQWVREGRITIPGSA